MITHLITFTIVIFGYFSGYLLSCFAASPLGRGGEEEAGGDKLTDRQRRRIKALTSDLRLFMQVIAIYKTFILTTMSFAVATSIIEIIPQARTLRLSLAIIAIIALWIGYILFVEYLPRRAARKSGGAISLRFSWVISLIYTCFYPVGYLFRYALRPGENEAGISEEEKEEIVERAIESLADQAGFSEAIIEEDEIEMIGHIFQLDQTVVREIMVPRTRIIAIETGTGIEKIQKLVREDGHSRYPVYDDTIDSIIGILYVKDLFSHGVVAVDDFELTKYIREPYVVPESKIISDLLREFKEQKIHIAIVVDEYGGVAGLVTLEDILEEIVGEIRDEHDVEEDAIRPMPDGSFIVDAGLLLEELQEHLNIEYDQGEFDTVGGLIYDLVGSVPLQGASVRWHDLEFKIERVDGQRISRVRVRYSGSSNKK